MKISKYILILDQKYQIGTYLGLNGAGLGGRGRVALVGDDGKVAVLLEVDAAVEAEQVFVLARVMPVLRAWKESI